MFVLNKYYCIGCGKEHSKSHFNISYNKLHNGVLPYCKNFIKKESYINEDDIDLDKFKSILQQVDRPFIANEWSKSLEDDRETIGSYFSRISLMQYKDLTWKDSVFVSDDEVAEVDDEGEEESKKFSKEWRGYYTESEIDFLNSYLEKLKVDFKITTTNHKDYAKKIAKTSLLLDRAYDDLANGYQGAEKRVKDLKDVFDSLCKSAQFSEDKRGITDNGMTCFARVSEQVEKDRWIPEYNEETKDSIDNMLEALKTINKSL